MMPEEGGLCQVCKLRGHDSDNTDKHPVVLKLDNVRSVDFDEGKAGSVVVKNVTISETKKKVFGGTKTIPASVKVKMEVERILDRTTATHEGLVDAPDFIKKSREHRLMPEGRLKIVEDKNNRVLVLEQEGQ